MTEKKAKLIVVLKADETIVAEVENPLLWQKVLVAIHDNKQEITIQNSEEPDLNKLNDVKEKNGGPLFSLAKKINVSESILEGAISPISDTPYLHLDRHCWEAMKKSIPLRGKGAIGATAMAATLLCLWLNELRLGAPTQSQALAVLRTIGVVDKNASRGIKSTSWLQSRPGGTIIINPAEISLANEIARSFCTKNWSGKE